MPCMLEKAKCLEEHIVSILRVKELVKQETSRIRWQAELRWLLRLPPTCAGFFDPEDEGSIFHWNIKLPPNYKVLQLRRSYSSYCNEMWIFEHCSILMLCSVWMKLRECIYIVHLCITVSELYRDLETIIHFDIASAVIWCQPWFFICIQFFQALYLVLSIHTF
jgi:hypothetical protein